MHTKIREARVSRGLTQKQVADRLNTSPGVISRWEKFPSRVNIPTLTNLARVLECSPFDLLVGEPEDAEPPAAGEAQVTILHFDPAGRAAPFNPVYLSRITSSRPEVLVMVTVSGDAMTPTFSDGDCAMVDTTEHRIIADGLYCLRVEDSAVIRRISIHPVTHKVAVRCDNVAYVSALEVEREQLDIIGKVIWRGGKV